jgi:hypothetical protein
MLRDPHLPVRPVSEGPEAGQPVIALETVLKGLGPPHLDPTRARVAMRHFLTAMGALSFFDADLVMRSFGADQWEYLDRELATLLRLAMDLQAALDRVRSARPPVRGGGR